MITPVSIDRPLFDRCCPHHRRSMRSKVMLLAHRTRTSSDLHRHRFGKSQPGDTVSTFVRDHESAPRGRRHGGYSIPSRGNGANSCK
nr:hypothetical protein CFP56_13016 [Quercus suber]